MPRVAPIALALVALAAAPAMAQDAGGAAAPGSTYNTGKAGGVQPGAGVAPVAHLSVRSGRRPRASVRFEEPGVEWVVARAVVLRSPGNAVAARAELGKVPTGRRVRLDVGGLAPGSYVVRVHAHDPWDNQLRRSGRATGKATLVVKARPQPKPDPKPEPPARSAPGGVFPVQGPYTLGDGVGADRGDRSHQGQDIAAAAGTPIVAPLAGTIHTTDYQAAGAGYYVVLNAVDGHAYFFAHCQKGSVAVETGESVRAGALLCRVGSSGRSSGPHLHFEQWANGWRTSKASTYVDPLPNLRAWAN